MSRLGNQVVKTLEVRGVKVDVVGCWDGDTPEGEFDFYDFYIGDRCLNEGEPYYGKPEDFVGAIEAHLDLRREMLT